MNDQILTKALCMVDELKNFEIDLKNLHRWGKINPHAIMNTIAIIVAGRTFIEDDIKFNKSRPELWEKMFVLAKRAFDQKAKRISYPN